MKCWIAHIAMCVIALAAPSVCKAEKTLLLEIERLDERFVAISSDFYDDQSQRSRDLLLHEGGMEHLSAIVKGYVGANDHVAAIAAIHANETLIRTNVDHNGVLGLVDLLLRHNDRYLADRLVSAVYENGDRALIANINFILAKYHAARLAWERVHELLPGSINELSPEDAAYAHLLDGVALQKSGKHRQAMERYGKVPDNSRYFPEALLNTAVASIRQGWWTDAEAVLRRLAAQELLDRPEIANRAYLIAGHALHQYGFYRSAREAFRKVQLNSIHANAALLGIGLAATSQGDFTGAINAFLYVKDRGGTDLATDETFLLLPYVYSQQSQEGLVVTGYTEALNHYRTRVAELKALAEDADCSLDCYDGNGKVLLCGNHALAYGARFPDSFMNNYAELRKLLRAGKTGTISAQLKTLHAEYANTFRNIRRKLVEERLDNIQDYLSQAQYGLAHYFDSTSVASSLKEAR